MVRSALDLSDQVSRLGLTDLTCVVGPGPATALRRARHRHTSVYNLILRDGFK